MLSRQSPPVAAVASLVLLLAGGVAAGSATDDYAVTAKAQIALMASWPLDARRIKVKSFSGELYLTGFVDSAASKADAARIAGKVRGVTAVRNELVIENRADLLTRTQDLHDSIIGGLETPSGTERAGGP